MRQLQWGSLPQLFIQKNALDVLDVGPIPKTVFFSTHIRNSGANLSEDWTFLISREFTGRIERQIIVIIETLILYIIGLLHHRAPPHGSQKENSNSKNV